MQTHNREITLEMHKEDPPTFSVKVEPLWSGVFFSRAMEGKDFSFPGWKKRDFHWRKVYQRSEFNRLLSSEWKHDSKSSQSCCIIRNSRKLFLLKRSVDSRTSVSLKSFSLHRQIISHSCFLSIGRHWDCITQQQPTQTERVVYTTFVHETNFLIPCFMIFGSFLGFSGLVFCFIFLFFIFLCRLEHFNWIFNIIIHSKQEVAKETLFVQFSSPSFLATEKNSSEHLKTFLCRMWSSVLCKLQKSLDSHKKKSFSCFSLSATRIKLDKTVGE